MRIDNTPLDLKVMMPCWSIKCQIYHQPGKNGKPIYKNNNAHTFHSFTFSFSFIPQGKLVCCNAVDLLGDEKPPGPSDVTGLK